MKEADYEKIKISYADNAGRIFSNKNFTCWGYFKLDGKIYEFKSSKNGNMNVNLVVKEFLKDKNKSKFPHKPILTSVVSAGQEIDIHQETPIMVFGRK